MSDDAVKAGYTAAEFHPDGMLLGTATADSSIFVWETRLAKVRCLSDTYVSRLQTYLALQCGAAWTGRQLLPAASPCNFLSVASCKYAAITSP